MQARDHSDATRQASPLRPAPDAHVIDTTVLSIDQVVARVLELVRAASSDRA
jgi:cytidylate kinase